MVGDKGVMYSPDDYAPSGSCCRKTSTRITRSPSRRSPFAGRRRRVDEEGMVARSRAAAAYSNFNYAASSTEAILLGNVAIRAGFQHPLEYDAENEFTNWPEANQFLAAEYRKGYSL